MECLILKIDSVGIHVKYVLHRACPEFRLAEMNLTMSGLQRGITHHGDFEKMSCHITVSFFMLIWRFIPICERILIKCRTRLVCMASIWGQILTGLMQMTCVCCRESMGYGGFRG